MPAVLPFEDDVSRWDVILYPPAGMNIYRAVALLVAKVAAEGTMVRFIFNDQVLHVHPGETTVDVTERWVNREKFHDCEKCRRQ